MGVEANQKDMRQLDDSLNRRDGDSFRDCFADDAIDHNVPEELGLGQGPDGVLELAKMQVGAIPANTRPQPPVGRRRHAVSLTSVSA